MPSRPAWINAYDRASSDDRMMYDYWFDSVDQDHSGEIDAAELERALSGSGDQFSKSTVDLMIRLFDADNSKKIDRREFQILFQYIRAMRDSFESYDQGRLGHIGPEELQLALQSAHYPFTSMKTIMILFKRFDKRMTGRLTFENFLEMALYLGNWRTVFNQHDTAGEGTIRVNMEEFIILDLANQESAF